LSVVLALKSRDLNTHAIRSEAVLAHFWGVVLALNTCPTLFAYVEVENHTHNAAAVVM
jgi:hypothetical protein